MCVVDENTTVRGGLLRANEPLVETTIILQNIGQMSTDEQLSKHGCRRQIFFIHGSI